MAQNIYDDPAFFAGYSEFPRSREGLGGTSEWPALRSMLPPIAGKRVLELGCGFGHFSRWAAASGAHSVLGIDLSEKMLERARAETTTAVVSYRREDLEHIALEPLAYDLVFSSMALHYIESFDRVVREVHAALMPGGSFVFSVEHPIFAARAEPAWVEDAKSAKVWAIADYSVEGPRVTNWVAEGVIKYHRTIATMLRSLIAAGFTLVDMDEWKPSDAQIEANPHWGDQLVCPTFLLLSLLKQSTEAKH